MHLPFDKLVTPTLLKRFRLEAEGEGGDGRYFACVLREDGHLFVDHPYGPQLAPEQMIWAGDVLRKLNRELHHDGAWVVAFTHPHTPPTESILHVPPSHADYGRYCLIWVDADGDPAFTQEWVEKDGDLYDFADVLLAGIESTMQKCECSWEMWHTAMRQVVAPKEGQTYKRAQGEQAPSTRH